MCENHSELYRLHIMSETFEINIKYTRLKSTKLHSLFLNSVSFFYTILFY